jgi:hypothetical protein
VLVGITNALGSITCVGENDICVGEYNISVGEYNMRW